MGMQAPASAGATIFAERSLLSRTSNEMLVPCERQRLAAGSALLERIRGIGTLANKSTSACRLVFQVSSRSHVHAAGRAAELEAGAWFASAGSAFDVDVQRGGELLSLSFPADELSRSLLTQIQAGNFVTQPVGGAAHMCLELARACLSQTEPMSLSVGDAMGDALAELAKLALIEQFCTKRGETVRQTVRTRIQSFIHRNLGDPDLTLDRIAERMQCTKRYLHKVFSEEDETLNQYIWSQRLEKCRSRLAQPELADRSITEIAFACGFSNAAHFSRSFRARFGEAPRAYRRAILERQASAALSPYSGMRGPIPQGS